jgi:hypothetical protein
MARLLASLALSSALGVALLGACGTDASGIDACRQIETARCQQAPSCVGQTISTACNGGQNVLDLAVPVHRDSDVSSCIRYYQDACLHGLNGGTPPSPGQLQNCVNAINAAPSNGDCTTVACPETNAACGFLIPTPPVDAGVDAPAAVDANDGAADAASE